MKKILPCVNGNCRNFKKIDFERKVVSLNLIFYVGFNKSIPPIFKYEQFVLMKITHDIQM